MIRHADNMFMVPMPDWYKREGHIAVTQIKARHQRSVTPPEVVIAINYQGMRIKDVPDNVIEGHTDEVSAQTDAEKSSLG